MVDAESLVGKDIYQFRLEKFLALGAVGLVFRAKTKVLNRIVALKLIPKYNQAFSGSGALSGNRLSISWSQGLKPGGFIVYTANANGGLSAVWGDGKGTEALVPIR